MSVTAIKPAIPSVVIVIAVVWFTLAEIVFAFRHPWATDTERLIHTADALMFRSIQYDSMRPR